MPDLDYLVKLASLGTSGICIFAIFWVGYLLHRSSKSDNENYHRNLRFYMKTVVIIAVISAASGVSNALIKQNKIAILEKEKDNVEEELVTARREKEVLETRVEEARKSLKLILESKEAYSLRNPDPELKTHIDQLKNYLQRRNDN